MRWKKLLGYGVVLVMILALLTNYTPLKGFLDLKQEYHYSTLSGELQTTESPFKGCDFECIQLVLEEYKQQQPQSSDTILYRTFRSNPLIIWHWHEYLFHPRYKLPYLKPEEANK